MRLKAIARYLYSTVPGLAVARFAVKDLTSVHFSKPEYAGALGISIGRGLIVDIGANRGQSIAAFKKYAPQSAIMAFEPEPVSAAKLTFRYRKDERVVVHDCALGEHCGKITFFVPTYGWWNCDGMSATTYQEATEWLQNPGRMLVFDKAKLRVSEHAVECRTLDSFGVTPRLIKLHAQGAELGILVGSERTIRQHRPALMCAFAGVAVTGLLAGWGYRPYVYRDGRFTPGIAERPVTFTWYLTDEDVKQSSVPL